MNEWIKVETRIYEKVEKVWNCWIKPDHIINWYSASTDWHTPRAVNNFEIGGSFTFRMEAKDGSAGFDFTGTYHEIDDRKEIKYTIADGRQVHVIFKEEDNQTTVTETFEAETTNSTELQKAGWQSILNNFKRYVEGMQKIVPHLWFDKEAVEATEWYVSLFEDSRIINVNKLSGTPSGEVDLVDFQLAGLRFSAISAGPYFAFNSTISLMVACASIEEVDRLYSHLSKDGTELMPLDEYPFSKRYAWLQDRYGLSWQLFMVEDMTEHQRIRPTLLFSSEVCGKAEDAIDFYLSIFEKSSKGFVNYYAPDEAADKKAKVNYGEMNLQGMEFVMMDHGFGGEDKFNEAFSFMVSCDNQEEIDYYWDRLSYVPEAEQCGWLKDRYGVSWQIVPSDMNDTMSNGSKEETERVTEAFLKMKKFDLAELERARLGK